MARSSQPGGDSTCCRWTLLSYFTLMTAGRTRRFMMRWSGLVCVLLATGCSGYWGRRPLDQPRPVEPKQPVWIWGGGEVMKWHAVVITQDSVSGIPYQMCVHCYSCRRSVPRTRVDSMKLGYRTLPENVTMVVGAATAAILVEAAVCSLLGARNDC